MKPKEFIFCILEYIALYIISFAIFVGLMHTGLMRGMQVLMYRGMVMILLAGILAAVLMAIQKKVLHIPWLNAKDYLVIFIISCCVNTVFFVVVPVTVERSVSVFMLSYMEQNPGDYTTADVEDIFIEKYVREYGAFEKRFQEQLVTGSIEEQANDAYQLTERGEMIVKMFRFIAGMFDTDRKLVYPNN